jgi:hypothetical protein
LEKNAAKLFATHVSGGVEEESVVKNTQTKITFRKIETKRSSNSAPGLPDVIFSYQKTVWVYFIF